MALCIAIKMPKRRETHTSGGNFPTWRLIFGTILNLPQHSRFYDTTSNFTTNIDESWSTSIAQIPTQTPTHLLRIFGQTINKNYANCFLTWIYQLNRIIRTSCPLAEQTNLLKQFILIKLEQKADEAVSTTPAKIQVIKDSLKKFEH